MPILQLGSRLKTTHQTLEIFNSYWSFSKNAPWNALEFFDWPHQSKLWIRHPYHSHNGSIQAQSTEGKGPRSVFYCTTASEELLSFQAFLLTTGFSELLLAFSLESWVKDVYRFHVLILMVKMSESTRLSYRFTTSVSDAAFPPPHFVPTSRSSAMHSWHCEEKSKAFAQLSHLLHCIVKSEVSLI